MTTIDEPLAQILADPLRAAAAGGALGYVGLDLPPDLLLAGGRALCHLPWRSDAATPRAAQWLEPSFPGWAHSILEAWSAGAFDCFTEVIFSRGEDVAHRLYYYVCELQRRGALRGPKPLVFDIARIPRDSSRRYTAAALRALARQLLLDDQALRVGIERANRLRRVFERVRGMRCGPGSRYERIVRASLFADIAGLLEPWVPEPESEAAGRVLLGGSAPPDDRFHRAVERAGWTVSDEFHERNFARLGPLVDATGEDPAAAIAATWLTHRFVVRDAGSPTARLLETARRARADVVILWFTREEEALAWWVPEQRRALEEAGLPVLLLTARAWNAEDGAAETMETFLRGQS